MPGPTSPACSDYRIYIADPGAGQIALYTVLDGKERPAILTLRMKVVNQRITEIESVYVGIGQSGMSSLDNLKTAAPIWSEVLPPAKRRTREEMIAITDQLLHHAGRQREEHHPVHRRLPQGGERHDDRRQSQGTGHRRDELQG